MAQCRFALKDDGLFLGALFSGDTLQVAVSHRVTAMYLWDETVIHVLYFKWVGLDETVDWIGQSESLTHRVGGIAVFASLGLAPPTLVVTVSRSCALRVRWLSWSAWAVWRQLCHPLRGCVSQASLHGCLTAVHECD
jgi:hypothetical protein